MTMPPALHTFVKDETGAVTIPWVVLGTGVFLMVVVTIAPVSQGAARLTQAVSAQLGGTTDKNVFN